MSRRWIAACWMGSASGYVDIEVSASTIMVQMNNFKMFMVLNKLEIFVRFVEELVEIVILIYLSGGS